MASLADGQLQTTKQTIYVVEHADGVSLEQINFFNDNAITQVIVFYVKRNGSSSRKLRRWSLDQNQVGAYLTYEERLTLSPGDELEAETTTAAAVDFFISGTLL